MVKIFIISLNSLDKRHFQVSATVDNNVDVSSFNLNEPGKSKNDSKQFQMLIGNCAYYTN